MSNYSDCLEIGKQMVKLTQRKPSSDEDDDD